MQRIPLDVKSERGTPGDPGAELDLEDPIVKECIRDAKDALGPLLDLLSPEAVLEHERFLALFITTHPAARPIYERLLEGRRKRPTNATSGPTVKEGGLPEGEAEAVGNGTEGRR
jgi:hypothetical protein